MSHVNQRLLDVDAIIGDKILSCILESHLSNARGNRDALRDVALACLQQVASAFIGQRAPVLAASAFFVSSAIAVPPNPPHLPTFSNLAHISPHCKSSFLPIGLLV